VICRLILKKKMNKALIIVGVGSHTKVQLRWFGHM